MKLDRYGLIAVCRKVERVLLTDAAKRTRHAPCSSMHLHTAIRIDAPFTSAARSAYSGVDMQRRVEMDYISRPFGGPEVYTLIPPAFASFDAGRAAFSATSIVHPAYRQQEALYDSMLAWLDERAVDATRSAMYSSAYSGFYHSMSFVSRRS